jgi:putative nucleotidyltransferase with HDIG domain
MALPISREQAIILLKKYPQGQFEMNHYLESGAVMKNLAKRLGEDEEYYEMLGLLHDVDWALTKDNPKEHLTLAPEILRKVGFDEEFIQIIISHGFGSECGGLMDRKRTKKIEYALSAAETITGLINAYAIIKGKNISNMEVSGLKKKFKGKAFAAGCDRERISDIEQVGISLDEFFSIAIEGIKNIKEQVGLS